MFNFFKLNKYKKNREINVFVCKHCKLSCKDCTTTFCYSCFVTDNNPCPRCGKTNVMPKEK